MPRYRQVINEDGSSTLVEIGTSRPANHSAAVQGDIEPFVSPVDGSVISDRKQLREHNRKHNVVNTAEFSTEFLERKRKERERLYTGDRTDSQIRKDRMAINDTIERLSRR
jgi:hypothetical protein